MKVDKAVCTTNDTLDDLQRAIRYETVFSTLVEKKILAIKRDAEARREQRKQTCFAGRFFRKKRLQNRDQSSTLSSAKSSLDGRTSDGRKECGDVDGSGGGGGCGGDEDAVEMHTLNRNGKSYAAQCNGNRDGESSSDAATTTVVLAQSQTVAVNVDLHVCNDSIANEAAAINEDTMKNDAAAEQCNSSGSTCAEAASQQTICFSSAQCATDDSQKMNTNADNVSGKEIGSKAESQPIKSALVVGGVDSANTNRANRQRRSGNHVKMIDGSPASTSSRLEVSISDDGGRRKPSSDTTISYPSSCKHTTFSAPEALAVTGADNERHRLRVLEAKSISAQCSPIFPRHAAVDSVATQVSYKNEIPGGGGGGGSSGSAGVGSVSGSVIAGARSKARKLFSRQNTSEDSVNVTFSSYVVNEEATSEGIDGNRKTIGSWKKNSKKDKPPGERLGFISNFNQLTAHNNLPVIATQLRAVKTAKLQRYLTTAGDGSDCIQRQKTAGITAATAATAIATTATTVDEQRFQPDNVRDKTQKTAAVQNSDEDDAKKNKRKSSKCPRVNYSTIK